MSDKCPECGADASDTWFDRTLCACGYMHTRCVTCGRAIDGCSADSLGVSE